VGTSRDASSLYWRARSLSGDRGEVLNLGEGTVSDVGEGGTSVKGGRGDFKCLVLVVKAKRGVGAEKREEASLAGEEEPRVVMGREELCVSIERFLVFTRHRRETGDSPG
jgi:hypothetical protein